jgi:hypothetical protein
MTQVIADLFQGETAREQSLGTGMTQRVRAEVGERASESL